MKTSEKIKALRDEIIDSYNINLIFKGIELDRVNKKIYITFETSINKFEAIKNLVNNYNYINLTIE